jgi:type VI secretion system secreted protein VgrG
MGKPASVTVRDVAGHERVITGVVAEAEVLSRDTGRIVRGRFVIRPAIYRQALGRDCWASQEVTAVDVIKAVLEDYPFTVRYDLTADYPKYPYRVQYREDDWTYISRLTEEEGIYYWFDHGDGESEIVFSDDSKSAPEIDGIPVLPSRHRVKPDQSAVLEVSFSARHLAILCALDDMASRLPGRGGSLSRHEV